MLAIRNLYPGYFALVMATGIISVAAHLLDLDPLARLLFLANLVAFGVLALLTTLRVILARQSVARDLADFTRGPPFLTAVVASSVVGSQFVVIEDDPGMGLVFWLLGCALWVVITYLLLAMLVERKEKPPLEQALNGSWLLLVVSTQSIGILATLVAPSIAGQGIILYFLGLSAFLLGGLLYAIIITLIVYRLVFRPMRPDQFVPSYWINMGAAAISGLAGATLADAVPHLEPIRIFAPFLEASSLALWAVATWWFPLLVGLELWSRLRARARLRYQPALWAMVFPLGMYATCSFRLGREMQLPLLIADADFFFAIALIAWAAVSTGLIVHGYRHWQPAFHGAPKGVGPLPGARADNYPDSHPQQGNSRLPE